MWVLFYIPMPKTLSANFLGRLLYGLSDATSLIDKKVAQSLSLKGLTVSSAT